MHLPNNTLLQDGKYKIVRFISSGGFGCTYEAEHVMLQKRMAIKEFFVKDFCNRNETTFHVTMPTQSKKKLVDKLLHKFKEEAQALSHLQHPGIVRVSDVFEENDTAYFVMDYIEGKSLRQIVKENGPLPEAVALRYIYEVARALSYVHDNNRLHLDIKPGNIMINQNDHAVLIDFGASKQYDEESGENTSTLLGKTPGYAPIEQLGNNVSQFLPATDIYALGATLYNLLTGVTPISADQLANDEALEDLPSYISKTVRQAIKAAMKVSKKQRPQTIKEFLSLLQNNTGKEATIFDLKTEKTQQKEQLKPSENNKTEEKKKKKTEEKNQEEGDKNIQDKKRTSNPSIPTYIYIIISAIAIISILCYMLFPTKQKDQENAIPLKTLENVKIDTLSEQKSSTSQQERKNDCIKEGDFIAKRELQKDHNENKINTTERTEASSPKQKAKQRENIYSLKATGSIDNHDYVDLGLNVNWGTCNIGADHPEDYGQYFRWGEILPASQSDNQYTNISLMEISGQANHDVAITQWGENWRIPSKKDFTELIDNCSFEWTKYKGTTGYIVKSHKNGNCIFLPAAGIYRKNQQQDIRTNGGYWSDARYDELSSFGLFFDKVDANLGWYDSDCGNSVRPVSNKK